MNGDSFLSRDDLLVGGLGCPIFVLTLGQKRLVSAVRALAEAPEEEKERPPLLVGTSATSAAATADFAAWVDDSDLEAKVAVFRTAECRANVVCRLA